LGKEWELSDGVISIRAFASGDTATLLAGRDEEWARWLGPGATEPKPTACILAGNTIVGWVDYDPDSDWLKPGEVNIGYNVFAAHRRKGYASRAVLLLLRRLEIDGEHEVGVLSIDRGNAASLGVARRAGFQLVKELPDVLRFERSVRAVDGPSI
jgi:RimJ/RimL family protein N-acetyltransferase